MDEEKATTVLETAREEEDRLSVNVDSSCKLEKHTKNPPKVHNRKFRE